MITNFIGRSATLLMLAFFLAISTNSNGQTVKTLPTNLVDQLLREDLVDNLHSHLVGKLKATVDKNILAESINISANGQTLNCEILSQLVSYNREKLELVSLRFTQGAKVRVAALVQYANGDLAELQGNNLVTYSHTKEVKVCAGDAGSECTACSAGGNAALARSAGIAQKISGFFKATKGNCLACYGDIDDVIECITGHRP